MCLGSGSSKSMTIIYRIYEIADNSTCTAAGWGDHASMADARRTVERWGRVVSFELDTEQCR